MHGNSFLVGSAPPPNYILFQLGGFIVNYREDCLLGSLCSSGLICSVVFWREKERK